MVKCRLSLLRFALVNVAMHKMAGVRHGSYSNALEALLSKKPLSKKDALQSSFKKELDAIISDVKKFGCSGEANSKLEPSGKL